MENEYVFIKDRLAFTVFIVSSDLANGRYQIFSTALNNVHHSIYNSIEDCEKQFDAWCSAGMCDAWYKKWNTSMSSLWKLDNDKVSD